MRRQPATAFATASAAALALATAPDAQACYENDHQCFSFAPAKDGLQVYDTGLTLGTDRLKISGDLRLRVRLADAPSDAPYNENDQQATRMRVAADFRVNESSHVFLEYNFSETWAGSKKYSDADPANPVNEISQAYFQSDDLLGLGDRWRIGRSNYTLGNGLILGSCDFLQYPSTFTGVWVSKDLGEHSVEAFAFDDYGQLSLMPGTRYAGATARIRIAEDSILESVDPFFMAGTGDGDVPSDDSWYGLNTGGTAPAEVDWTIQYAHRAVDGGEDLDAYRARVGKRFESLVEQVSFTRTDSQGAMHVNPADFNSAGLLHQYGGAWRSDLETNQLAVELAPSEDVDLDFNLLRFGGDGATLGETELDVLLGKQLSPGVYGSLGYGLDNDSRQVGYIQLSVFF